MNKSWNISLLITLVVFNINSNGQISSFNPVKIIGGISQKITINGSGFGNLQGKNYVTFLQESGSFLDTSNAKKLKYTSWSDTKIEVEMPVAYSGKIKVNINGIDKISNDTLKVKANQGYRSANPIVYDYLNNTNGKGGYTWYMHRTYWENPAAKTAIEDVFKEFRCKTGVNYILANAPSDAAFSLGDGINIIGPDITLGAVGFTDRLWISCFLGAEIFYTTKAMDIRMSTTQDWYFGGGTVPSGKSKFRYVLLHELGHSLGLGHVNEIGQTMFPSVTNLPSNNWNKRDSITTDEQIAITYLVKLSQTFSFNACGISTLSKISNCNDVYGLTSEIDRFKKKITYSFYPNPAFDRIYFNTNQQTLNGSTIRLMDILGRHISTEKINTDGIVELYLTNLKPGSYIVEIENKNEIGRLNLIKK